MAPSSEPDWNAYWKQAESTRSTLTKTKSVNINKDALRTEVQELVQEYFRSLRPALVKLGLNADVLAGLDTPAQDLLRLATARNARASYLRSFRALLRARVAAEQEREMKLGHAASASHVDIVTAGMETQILATLRRLLPSAALSYEQALRDLRGAPRLSYRGTAVELRETLREVLDHLAPDADVMRSPGFKSEKDAARPTMKQKAHFILKARGAASGAISTPKDAIQRVEDASASLARSVYTRGSVSTHVATTREEVLTMKPYVDGVLAELLQVHHGV
jgi:Predicted pPIWI-associating nuclease